ncbi:hypothetical protein E3N88_33435 [Mikania micrantha]|uniref:Uncharacterized protein n=1 Tax=Mikania micrantha TaxID=192012 RepID=A0A5N6MBG3_9ASTR|nr:hypothetical protein E3N88_33435 [Mikania micrantha]
MQPPHTKNPPFNSSKLHLEGNDFFERYRPRSSRKCVMKVPAAVGHNMRTAVKGAAYAYDGLNDLSHVMIYGLIVIESCAAQACLTSGQQLTAKFLHRMNDVMMVCMLCKYVMKKDYDEAMMARGRTQGLPIQELAFLMRLKNDS